jgi:hypothetical protein
MDDHAMRARILGNPAFFVGFPLHGVKAGYIARPYRAAARPA